MQMILTLLVPGLANFINLIHIFMSMAIRGLNTRLSYFAKNRFLDVCYFTSTASTLYTSFNPLSTSLLSECKTSGDLTMLFKVEHIFLLTFYNQSNY